MWGGGGGGGGGPGNCEIVKRGALMHTRTLYDISQTPPPPTPHKKGGEGPDLK